MLEPGRFRFDIQFVATRLDASHVVEREQFEPGIPDQEQPRRHVLALELADATLTLAVGLARRLNLELELPFRRIAIDASFLDGEERSLADFLSIHHRTETISGIADVGLWLRYRLPAAAAWTVDLRSGLTAPSGDTEPDPFALGELGEAHQHIFFGTGTWDPQIGLDASRPLAGWRLSGWLRARLTIDGNAQGYRAGERGRLGLGIGRTLGTSGWSIRGQVEAFHEEASRWRGREARNSGRTDVILGLAGGFRPPRSPWTFYGLLRLPENLRARGGQVELTPIVTLGVSVRTSSGR